MRSPAGLEGQSRDRCQGAPSYYSCHGFKIRNVYVAVSGASPFGPSWWNFLILPWRQAHSPLRRELLRTIIQKSQIRSRTCYPSSPPAGNKHCNWMGQIRHLEWQPIYTCWRTKFNEQYHVANRGRPGNTKFQIPILKATRMPAVDHPGPPARSKTRSGVKRETPR